MFDKSLEVKSRSLQAEAPLNRGFDQYQRPKQTFENRPDITWVREERNDISYSGYKRYFYEFENTATEEAEIAHCVISAASMDEAIQVFLNGVCNNRLEPRGGATIYVTVIGIDIRKDDAPDWVGIGE